MTDGYDTELNNLEISQIRQQEFEKAMECAQVHGYFMLHIPEHEIPKNKDKFNAFDFSQYSHIFVPNRNEGHRDHVAVYKMVKGKLGNNAKLYEYEVWTTIRKPNIIVDISPVIEQKQKMILCHASQVKDLDYWALASGLNAYRGQTHGLRNAEAYYCRKELIAEKIRHLKRRIRELMKRG